MRKTSTRVGLQAGFGILYVCFGELYEQLTALSILQLRRCGYLGPVRILTDARRLPSLDAACEIVRVPSIGIGFATRYYKTQIHRYAFDTTLFLDADAIPILPISSIWRELRFASLCMTLDLHPTVRDLIIKSDKGRERRMEEYLYMSDLDLIERPLYSSGVMLFRRSEATDELFDVWHEEWIRFRNEDQLALVRAVERTRFPVRTLAPRWNARLSRYGSIDGAQISGVRILHLRPESEPVPSELLEAYA